MRAMQAHPFETSNSHVSPIYSLCYTYEDLFSQTCLVPHSSFPCFVRNVLPHWAGKYFFEENKIFGLSSRGITGLARFFVSS